MNRFKLLHIAYIGILLLSLFLFTKPSSVNFMLDSTIPKNKMLDVSVKDPVSFTFSHILDSETPYKSFAVTPKTDGQVVVKNDVITFTPSAQFAENTTYKISITEVTSITKTKLKPVYLQFKTGARKLTKFEASLPYKTDSYTIDLLSDGTIFVTVFEPPADSNAEQALQYIKSWGVDTTKVLVQNTASSAE